MANRFAEDIRRIAGIEDDKGTELGESKEREKIPGGRGVGYYSGSGGQVSSDSGFPSGSGAGVPGNSANNPQGDSSTNTTGGGGSSTGGTGAGQQAPFDASNPYSLITPEDGAYTCPEDVIDKWSANSLDALKALQGTDPDSGDAMDVHLEIGFPPPEGWDDASIPPNTGVDPTYTAGYYYESVFGTCGSSQSATEQAECMVDVYIANPTYKDAEFIEFVPSIPSGDTTTGFFVTSAKIELTDTNDNKFFVTQGIHRFQCGVLDPDGPGDYCSILPPSGPEEYWPVQDKIIIDFTAASTKTSPYQDPTDLENYTQGETSKLNMESCGGGRNFSVEKSATGGNILYETSGANGPPIGNFKVFDTSGQMIAVGNTQDGSLDAYRPPPA
jgi:hypothetical protein